MRYFARIFLLTPGLTLALSACGLGGTSSTPTPPPTNTDLTNLQYSQTFASSSTGLITTIDTNSLTTSAATPEPASASPFKFSYDAATQSYTVSVPPNSQSYGPVSKDTSSSDASTSVYAIKSGNTTHSLALFNPGSGNPKLALTYTSYGGQSRVVNNGSTIDWTSDFFIFGIPTDSASLPRTGSASYQTVLDGLWSSGGDLRALTGTASFSADFAAGTTNLGLSLGGTSVLNSSTQALGTFTGPGTIDMATSAFSGNLTSTDSAYSGSYSGYFFGPNAAEAGASFSLIDGSGGVASGVVVGKK